MIGIPFRVVVVSRLASRVSSPSTSSVSVSSTRCGGPNTEIDTYHLDRRFGGETTGEKNRRVCERKDGAGSRRRTNEDEERTRGSRRSMNSLVDYYSNSLIYLVHVIARA